MARVGGQDDLRPGESPRGGGQIRLEQPAPAVFLPQGGLILQLLRGSGLILKKSVFDFWSGLIFFIINPILTI